MYKVLRRTANMALYRAIGTVSNGSSASSSGGARSSTREDDVDVLMISELASVEDGRCEARCLARLSSSFACLSITVLRSETFSETLTCAWLQIP